ncbi:MAG TPA: LacI family DNA-binding transcriptional regulator [Pilimelia sp.]|nr:LacI family DNA-binding transcriptional regulator [Pilimelia sp.]
MAQAQARRVTSADVAREAGLSRATVSYVLNDAPHQKIPEETRQRVLAAAARLGYAPSAAARALRSGRSDVVLCLLPNWPMGPAVGALMSNLSAELARHGMTFVLHPSTADARPTAEIWKAITPAAVLAFEELSAAEVAAMRAAGVALVVALLGSSKDQRRELEVQQQRVGRLQAEHLVAAGHTRIGYASPDDERLRSFVQPRLEGVRTACVESGLDAPVVRAVPLDTDGAAQAVRAWRAGADAVTGVCAYNDDVALAVLAGLRTVGLAAPADVAVVGVDDIPAARLAAPPLTTVTVDLTAVAAHLAATIVAASAGHPEPPPPGSDIVQITVRESA